MERLHHFRHGESEANVEKRIAGSQDSPLTERGREQAEARGRELAASGILFDHIITSPLTRAEDTAKIIAKHVNFPIENIVTDEAVKERSAGDLEGKLKSEAKGKISGEDLKLFGARVLAFYESVQKLEGNVAVVSHSGVGKMLDIISQGGDPETLFEHNGFENASVTEITPDTEFTAA